MGNEDAAVGSGPGGHAMRAAARLAGLFDHGMPLGPLPSRSLLGWHLLRKARREVWQGRPVEAARSLLAEAIFLEIAHRQFGPNSMIRSRHGFFPHIFLPDYHGPCFDEAIRRLVLPGRGPNILYFSLTGVCPCHCEYCFAGAGGGARDDIGDETALRVAAEVAALRVPLVNISGGEPLARFERLLSVVRILSAGCEVRVFTTGIGLTAERLDALREAGLKGVFVSLDGDDAEAFDRARGHRGAFAAATEALRRCAAAGMLTFVNCVVDRRRFRNEIDISRFLEFVEQIDSRIVVNFLPQLATGRGADADSFRSPEDCDAVAARVVETAKRMRRPVSMLFGAVDRFIGCPGAGGKLMNIDIAGNVTICISRAALGNVLEEPFEAIHARFLQHCRRLKVGFFCCAVSERSGDGVIDAAASRVALADFYAASPDAAWQRIVDRWGDLITRLLPAESGTSREATVAGCHPHRHIAPGDPTGIQ